MIGLLAYPVKGVVKAVFSHVTSFLALLALAAVGFQTPAFGHADLVRSEPANGAQLKSIPDRLVLHYSEGIQLADIQLLDGNGRHIDLGEVVKRPDDDSILEVSVGHGVPSIFTVRWQVFSNDGHTTSGAYFFVVGSEIPSREDFLGVAEFDRTAPQLVGTDIGILERLVPWFKAGLLLALMVLFGLPVSIAIVLPNALRDARVEFPAKLHGTARRILAIAGIVFVLTATLMMLQQFIVAPGYTSWLELGGFVTSTQSGYIWAVQIVAMLSFLAVMTWRPSSGRCLLVAWLAGAIGAVTVNMGSHTAILIGVIGGLADLAHLSGAALWVGGLVLLVAFPLVSGGWAAMRQLMVPLLRRFSLLAVTGLGLATASGFLMGAYHLPDLASLVDTFYGLALLVKVALVAAAVAMGALVRFRLLDQVSKAKTDTQSIQTAPARIGKLLWALRLETSLVAATLVAIGYLTSVAPATASQDSDMTEQHRLTAMVEDINISVAITPFRTGLNLFDVEFEREGEPVSDVENAHLLLWLPAEGVQLPQVLLEPLEPGLFSSVAALTSPGLWKIRAGGFVGGVFRTATFDAEMSTPDAQASGQADPGQINSFGMALRWLAAAAAVIAFLLIGREYRVGWRKR